MKKITWRKHHKWVGLLFCFFLLMFCISGILLNHRSLIASVDISRKWLPQDYHFQQWNNGLLRGTLTYECPNDSNSFVLLYGNGGIWKTDSCALSFDSFNSGLPNGADYRAIRNMVQTSHGELFAVTAFNLFQRDHAAKQWKTCELPTKERLSDITLKGDSLLVVGRSHIYVSLTPYRQWKQITLKQPEGFENKVTLFRTIWLLHSGALFGMAGKMLIDLIAVVLIFLCITGLLCWFLPAQMKRLKHKGKAIVHERRLFKKCFDWHNLIGRKTILLTLFVCITGWCLRPPLMIPLAISKVSPIPFSELDSPNPWNDRLRMLRYDDSLHDWILSSSEGFFSLESLDALPVAMQHTPPVSVMGLNVFQKNEHGEWLVGSFSGLSVWNRQTNRATDFFTHQVCKETNGAPFGQKSVSGYSDDFTVGSFAVEYGQGTQTLHQPNSFVYLPMSLWNLALEIHTGRIYTILGVMNMLFVFVAGIFSIWCLWSGWKMGITSKKKDGSSSNRTTHGFR